MSSDLAIDLRRSEALAGHRTSGWRQLLRASSWVTITGLANHMLGAVNSLLLRWLLAPADMGVWQILKLLLSYSNFVNLGASKAAARELSLSRGRGESAACRRSINLAFTMNVISSAVYALLLVGTGMWIGWSAGWRSAWPWGLMAIGALAIAQRHTTFRVTLSRARENYRLTGQLALLEPMVALATSAIGVWLWGLAGLYLSALAVLAVTQWMAVRDRAEDFALAWSRREVLDLLTVGSPLLLSGVLASALRSVDRWMILACLPNGATQLGCYSISLMIVTQVFGMGNLLSIVLGPRYARWFGETGCARATALRVAQASELTVFWLSTIAAATIVAAPPLLGWLLSDYREGIQPMIWAVPGAVALALAQSAQQYSAAIARQRQALAMSVVSVGVATASQWCALSAGWGIAGSAVAASLSYLVYAILSATDLWRALAASDRRRWLIGLTTGCMPLVVAIAGVTARGEGISPIAAALLSIAIAMTCAAVGIGGWRAGGWRERWHTELAT